MPSALVDALATQPILLTVGCCCLERFCAPLPSQGFVLPNFAGLATAVGLPFVLEATVSLIDRYGCCLARSVHVGRAAIGFAAARVGSTGLANPVAQRPKLGCVAALA